MLLKGGKNTEELRRWSDSVQHCLKCPEDYSKTEERLYFFCRRAVLPLLGEIFKILTRMLQRDVQEVFLELRRDAPSRSAKASHEVPASAWLQFEEGRLGRQGTLRGPNSASRGSVLHRELPLLVSSFTRDLTPPARQEQLRGWGSLQPAHVELAWGVIESEVCFDGVMANLRPPVSLSQKLDPHCKILLDTTPRKDWSFAWPSLITMCVVSVIMDQLHRRCGSMSTQDCDMIGLKFFRVLNRLPHNSLAISGLKQLDGSQSHVITKDLRGISVFLNASALNHSCEANAVIRYCFPSNGFKGDPCDCCLEVVALCDIPPHEEVLISYGPIASMTPAKRQEVLWRQYLFHCKCILCSQQAEEPLKKPSSETMHLESAVIIPRASRLWRKIAAVQEALHASASGDSSILCEKQLQILKTDLQSLRSLISRQAGNDVSTTCKETMLEMEYMLHDALGQSSACRGDYDIALEHSTQAVSVFAQLQCSKGLQESDILISRERVKVLQLLFACNKRKECCHLGLKLLRDMHPFVDSESDSDFCIVKSIMSEMS